MSRSLLVSFSLTMMLGLLSCQDDTETAANTDTISTNTTAIAANATAISANTTAIPANTTAIAANATAISADTDAIASNATAISASAVEIASNTETISANATANAGVIADHETRIASLEARLNTCIGSDATDLMVKVGSLCVDKYEASVWSSPLAGGTRYGASSDDYPCNDNGNDCGKTDNTGTPNSNAIFARSQTGVLPSGRVTWFQAQQACANVGKRLLTNAEWQMAAAGTPDPSPDVGDCNIDIGGTVANTGSFVGCVSNWLVNDMVGNVHEWVADWVPLPSGCTGWNTPDDKLCLAGADVGATTPGFVARGGAVSDAQSAGVFAFDATYEEGDAFGNNGFRCGR